MPSRHIQAVVFDLDDTLYRERDYVRSGLMAVGEVLRQRTGRRADFAGWMWRQFRAGRRTRIFDAAGARFGLALSRRDIADLVAVYRTHRPAIRPCRNVAALLRRLGRRFKLGLLSDGFLPAQQLKLDGLDLGLFFDAIVFTEQIARSAWKPSPRGFDAMRKRLGVPHAACCYVADNPAKDFVAPNALGWLTVCWRRSGQVHAGSPAPSGGAPKMVIRSGPELIRRLRIVRRTARREGDGCAGFR